MNTDTHTQHTPGPWTIEDGRLTQQDHIDRLAEDIKCPDRQWVAVGTEDAEGYAESVAYCHPSNARLVAAAPELLAALRECAKQLSAIGAKGHASVARAAIAKAEGRA